MGAAECPRTQPLRLPEALVPVQPVTTVLLVDNHDIVRRGLRSVLELEDDIEVIGEASGVAQALEETAKTHPDIVVLDLKLSDGAPAEGLELCSKLTSYDPEIAVIVFTAFVNHHLLSQAVGSGARGYVQKDVDTGELLRAIRAVKAGGSGFDSRTARVLAGSLGAGALSEREMDIVRLVSKGFTNVEIAARTYISESTVKYHLRSIMRKLGAHNRAGVVRAAEENGLI